MAGVRFGDVLYEIAPHAIERYVERVRPTLTFAQAEVDLIRLLPFAVLTSDRPVWTGARRSAFGESQVWALLTEAIAFPVVARTLVTCVTRGEVGAEVRLVERAERARLRERKRRPGTREKHGKVARQARRERRNDAGGQ